MYYCNEVLINTTTSNWDDTLLGFQITDWQGDMDCTIQNFKIYKR